MPTLCTGGQYVPHGTKQVPALVCKGLDDGMCLDKSPPCLTVGIVDAEAILVIVGPPGGSRIALLLDAEESLVQLFQLRMRQYAAKRLLTLDTH